MATAAAGVDGLSATPARAPKGGPRACGARAARQGPRLRGRWTGRLVAAGGGGWWSPFHRRKVWWVWVLGAIPVLAVYAVFCFYLERVLPPGY